MDAPDKKEREQVPILPSYHILTCQFHRFVIWKMCETELSLPSTSFMLPALQQSFLEFDCLLLLVLMILINKRTRMSNFFAILSHSHMPFHTFAIWKMCETEHSLPTNSFILPTLQQSFLEFDCLFLLVSMILINKGTRMSNFLPSYHILTCHFTHLPFEKCVKLKLNLAYLKYKLLCDITARAYLVENMIVLL
jgi:hypothetical protein